MREIRTLGGRLLFSFNENETTLAKEIGKYKELAFADLKGADLTGAKLTEANLKGADLRHAKLSGANLQNADLFYANLFGADLSDADIEGADLRGARNVPYVPIACPSEGSFIAWKKVGYDFLVKLEIPGDARRCSATTKKCRCDKAFVLDIEDRLNGEHPNKVVNHNYCECVYEVGKMVYPDWFDENRWNECSHGIHFFMDKQDAIEY